MASTSTVVSQTQIHPSNSPSSPRSCPLSIIDASIANYGISSAVWFFPPPSTFSSSTKPPYTPSLLTTSLQHTLSLYPQWTGHLQMYPYNPDDLSSHQDHTKRFARPWLYWGTPNDPGLELVISTSSIPLAAILPPEKVVNGISNLAKPGSQIYLPPSETMVKIREKPSGFRAIGVKITTFPCGGLALGVSIHHTLADAQVLTLFVSDWGRIHRTMMNGNDPSSVVVERPFNPLLLDGYAAGDVDTERENEEFKRIALGLPQIRLDWWASSQGKPGMISSPTEPDPLVKNLAGLDEGERGKRIPWETWDYGTPVRDYLFEFSPEEIDRIWRKASGSLRGDSGDRLSRLDAFQAHLWKVVVRARKLPSEVVSYIDMSLGLRSRLNPPLPSTFLGSPIVNFSTFMKSSEILSTPLSNVAGGIRGSLNQFNEKSVPALLHHLAYSIDPIRYWNAFMGNHHLMVTSWLGIGTYDGVDFGAGAPKLVIAGLWPVDGLVVFMDLACGSGNEKWYDRGIGVRLFLKEDVMERVVADPELRGESCCDT